MLYNFYIKKVLNLLRIESLNTDFISILRVTRITSTLIEVIIIIITYSIIRNITHRDYTINIINLERFTYINKYRLVYINIKDIIALALLKIKKIYNSGY